MSAHIDKVYMRHDSLTGGWCERAHVCIESRYSDTQLFSTPDGTFDSPQE